MSDDHRGSSSRRRPDKCLPPPPEPGDDAYITDEDIQRAAAAWREAAPAEMRDLLDARSVDGPKPPTRVDAGR